LLRPVIPATQEAEIRSIKGQSKSGQLVHEILTQKSLHTQKVGLPLWEGDLEVVKRSGRDEPVPVIIHMCKEAMFGISLYRDLYFKLAKMLCLFYYLLCFLFSKRRRGQNRFCLEERGGGEGREKWEAGGRDDPNNVYT
jgi:hypothetical protein